MRPHFSNFRTCRRLYYDSLRNNQNNVHKSTFKTTQMKSLQYKVVGLISKHLFHFFEFLKKGGLILKLFIMLLIFHFLISFFFFSHLSKNLQQCLLLLLKWQPPLSIGKNGDRLAKFQLKELRFRCQPREKGEDLFLVSSIKNINAIELVNHYNEQYNALFSSFPFYFLCDFSQNKKTNKSTTDLMWFLLVLAKMEEQTPYLAIGVRQLSNFVDQLRHKVNYLHLLDHLFVPYN